jgi:outer membrane scaffolding protein for murein synthesis (MipA/OmpV family)
MPELDFLFEVGPQLVYRVKDFAFNSGGKARLNFRLQTRAVFSTDLERLDHRGFVFEPRLTYQQRGRLHPDTGLNISISATFGTERLNDYFYEVSSEFVTANRAQFDASSGYIGTELSVGFSFPVTKNIRGFVGADMQLLHGAENRNSPLFEDKITFGVAAGFVWRMYQSKRRANW